MGGFPKSFLLNEWTPSQSGLLAWTVDNSLASNNLTLTPGVLHLDGFELTSSQQITNVLMAITNTPAILANSYLGIYSAAGVLLGSTADQSSAWAASPNTYTTPLSSVLSLPAGIGYVGILVGSAGTAPQIASAPNPQLNKLLELGGSISAGTLAGGARAFAYGSGLTALPATISGTPGIADRVLCFGLS